MSEHTIEDLVEDSVRLVLAAPIPSEAQRDLIGELYAFQALYDTADTMGRLRCELAAIGFDGQAPVRSRSWLEIAADVIALADKTGDRQLVHHWLGVLATGIDDLTLIGGGLPEDFPAFLDCPSALAIRETAMRHDVFRWRGKAGYVKLPTYRSLADGYGALDPATLDRRLMLRLLLDHKSDPARIHADYEKERARIALTKTSALFDLPRMVEARGPFRFVGQSKSDDRHTFVFHREVPAADPDASSLLLVLEHIQGFNTLHMTKAIRSGLIARWQNKTFHADDTSVHFKRDMLHFIPREKLDAEKHLNAMGWRYRMDQSAKVLEQRLNSMLALWGYGRKMEEFYRTPLAERIDQEGFAGMSEARLSHLERFGFFASEVDILFACACRSWDRGIQPDAENAAIADWLRHIRPEAPGRADRIAALARLRSGPAFPGELERWPYRRHEEAFPLDADPAVE